jgi:ElaB/YqjD/DUF883 family membrane-anchored ribosome-binding protein
MDPVQDPAEYGLDEMREEIDTTRTAMADKIEALEDRVMDTIHSAEQTVEETVATVKTSVRDTVATVKRAFDVCHHVQTHPWLMVGGFLLGGLALGRLARKLRQRSRRAPELAARNGATASASTSVLSANSGSDSPVPPHLSRSAPAPTPRPGVFDLFHEEIDKVKGMSIGYVLGLARDAIEESVPQLAAQIQDVMNSVTTKLGGEPVPPHSR